MTSTEHSKRMGRLPRPALGRMTLCRFVDEQYRATMVGLEPSTRVMDESYLRSDILPAFGDRSPASIGCSDCHAWVNELSTRRPPATVVKAAQIMGEVGPRYRALVGLGCYGGPRIGELLALRWSDLDVLRRIIAISRQPTCSPEHGQALADRLDAFVAASEFTPAAAVVQLRPFGCAPDGHQAWRRNACGAQYRL